MPRKFDFGGDSEGTDDNRSPRRLSFDEPAITPVRAARKMNLPTEAPEAAPEPSRRPRPLTIDEGKLTHERKERPRTLTDALIDEALARSPDIDPARVRGRIDMLLKATTDVLIKWGEANLLPLQEASKIQAHVANEMQRIDAVGSLNETKDAISGNRGFLDRFTQKKPEHYEFRLNVAKRALTDLMILSEQHRAIFLPEVHDLHLDSIALVVVLSEFKDATRMNIANNRSRTLLMAHQTGTMLLTVLENTVQQCAQFIEQIDSMLSVTIPQWKIAQG